jgi:aldehyde dehydrogenase (NAD+)
VEFPLDGIDWSLKFAEQYAWEEELSSVAAFNSRRYLRREPVGVVGAITPWNFPLQVNLAKLIPALASGCTVVLKAAPDTPWTATLLGQLVSQYTEMPPGVLNIITSSDHSLGRQLVEDPRVDMISFTGSTATGSDITVRSAPTLKRLFLELGGKSANVVLDDADLEAAVAMSVMHVTTHAGQGCAILSRLILPESRYDEGVEAVVEALRNVPYGDPTDPTNVFGPLIRAQQRDRVLNYIKQGISDGAELALGGGRPGHLERGFFVEPTVLANVNPDAVVAQEEIFGPVLVVLSHKGDDDAVAIANNSFYGLSGAVFSGDIERARDVSDRVRTGTMSLNGGVWYGSEVPFGGYKHSGVGRENGRVGFEEYLETKSVAEPI